MLKRNIDGYSAQSQAQVGKSACIVLAKERHSKGERVPFSGWNQSETKLKPEAANTLSLRTPWSQGMI